MCKWVSDKLIIILIVLAVCDTKIVGILIIISHGILKCRQINGKV